MMSTTTNETMTDARALAATLAEVAGSAGDHPRIDRLADYLTGDLAPGTEARIQDHLVACRDCSAQLLDLESLSEPSPQIAEGVADLATAAAWREQKTRIADHESSRRYRRTMRWVSAVAASFFVATIGLSAHVAQLRRTVTELSRPEVNLAVLYLDSEARTRGIESTKMVVRKDQDSAVLFLTPAGEAFAEYEVEVLSAAGSQVWQSRDLQLSDRDTLRFLLPLKTVPAAEYHLRLYGHEGDRRELLEEFSIHISHI